MLVVYILTPSTHLLLPAVIYSPGKLGPTSKHVPECLTDTASKEVFCGLLYRRSGNVCLFTHTGILYEHDELGLAQPLLSEAMLQVAQDTLSIKMLDFV